MSTFKAKQYAAEAAELVARTLQVVDELVLAISEDNNTDKYCFAFAIAEEGKIVEKAKEEYSAIAKEFDSISEQLESAKKRLSNIKLQYKDLKEENQYLKKSIQTIKSEDILDEDAKQSNDSRLKLELYKKMTGVHFDVNTAEDEVTGFIAIKREGPKHSSLVPFIFQKDDPTISRNLWVKIGEGLGEVNDNN